MSNYLIHYNHNHDALGRFARSAGSSIGSKLTSRNKKEEKNNSTRKFESNKRLADSNKRNKKAKQVEVRKANDAIAKNKQKGSKSNNTKLSDAERRRLIESGSAKEITKNKDKLSNRELETAINRLQKEKISRMDLEKKLSDLNSPSNKKQKQSTLEKLNRMSTNINTLVNITETGIRAYNTMAKIHNSRNPGEKWVVVGEKSDPPSSDYVKRLIKTASAEEVFNNRGKMTIEEMKKANNRLQQEKAMRGYVDSEKEYYEKQKKK